MKVLEIKNLSKHFGDRVAVDSLNLDVFEGEILAFIGTNGAGKTTTMRMVLGLAKPTSGDVLICGSSIKKSFEKTIAYVGGIIESPIMYNYMSGIDNLKYYASLYKTKISKSEIDATLKLVGLESRGKDLVRKYSLGMRQRLGIAQALLHRPKLLILDEPTNGLDANAIREMRVLLKQIARKQGVAIMISSHILKELEEICDTVAIIDEGKLVVVQSINQMKYGNKNEQKIRIRVDYPNYALSIIKKFFPDTRVDIAGDSVVLGITQAEVNAYAQTLMNNHITVFNIEVVERSLEELFLSIVQNKRKYTSIS